MRVTLRILCACMAAGTVMCMTTDALAQNTITPKRIEELNTDITWPTSAFADINGRFRAGNQWSPPVLGSISKALRLGVTMDMYGYFDTTETSHFHKLHAMTADSNFLLWGNPLGNVSDDSSRLFTSYFMGIRFEPSETGGCGRNWSPRDDSAWPLSFTYKYGGSVPSSPADENYRRYVLTDTDTIADTPVVVLADPEPREHLYMRNVSSRMWADPLFFDFNSKKDSTNGHRLQVVINLRRTNSADTNASTEPVITLRVPYRLRWKHMDTLSNRFVGKGGYMPFRRVPRGSRNDDSLLPQERGREILTDTVAYDSTFQDSIVITRAMLPLHADAGDPDITVVAEFRTDTILARRLVDGVWHTVRRSHLLKSGVRDYPGWRATDAELDSASLHKRYHAIDTLSLEVSYHGGMDVGIRSVSILTPHLKNVISGTYDSLWASALDTHIDSLIDSMQVISTRYGRPFRVIGFYLCDEFGIEHLLGMRYRLDLFGGRLTSEHGVGAEVTYADDQHNEYGPQKMQGFPTRYP